MVSGSTRPANQRRFSAQDLLSRDELPRLDLIISARTLASAAFSEAPEDRFTLCRDRPSAVGEFSRRN